MNITRLFQVTVELKTLIANYWLYFEDPFSREPPKIFLVKEPEAYFEILEVLDGRFKCLSVRRKDSFSNLNYNLVLTEHAFPGQINFLVFKDEISNSRQNVAVMLTPGNIPLTKDISRKKVPPSALSKITWQGFQSTRLPIPFEDKCRDYSKSGFLSRGDCFKKCLIKFMDEETNGSIIPPGIYVVENEVSNMKKRFFSFNEIDSSEDGNNTWQWILHRKKIHCEKKCHAKECESITYSPIVWEKTESKLPALALTIPFTPTISSTSLPAVSVVQFLTDVVSALGFWLGISALGVVDHIKKFVTPIMNAKETKCRVQKVVQEVSCLQKHVTNLRNQSRMLRRSIADIEVVSPIVWSGSNNHAMNRREFKQRIQRIAH